MSDATTSAPKSRAMVLPALGAAVVAISFAAILFRLAPGLHPLAAAGWRLVIAGLVLLPFVRRLPRSAWRVAPLAGVAYAVHFGAWVASLGLLSVLVSTTVVTTTPLMLAAVALMSGRDRPRARALVGMALGMFGVVLLATSLPAASNDNSLHGILLALLGAAAAAVYLLMARRVNFAEQAQPWRGDSNRKPPSFPATLAFSGIAALVGGVVLLLSAVSVGAPLLPTTTTEVWVIVGAAALPQLVGHTMMTWALTRVTPTTVALATLGEPIGAALLAAALLDEPLTALGIGACCLTLGAVALALSDAR